MEQLEFDCRLESERELEENVNIALEFACKQVKETSKSKVSNRHDGYGIASEFYAGMKLDQKKVDESMKDFLRILPTEDDAKAVEAASSLKNAATGWYSRRLSSQRRQTESCTTYTKKSATTPHRWKIIWRDSSRTRKRIRKLKQRKNRRTLSNE